MRFCLLTAAVNTS